MSQHDIINKTMVSDVHKRWYNILIILVFNIHFALNKKNSPGTYWTPLIMNRWNWLVNIQRISLAGKYGNFIPSYKRYLAPILPYNNNNHFMAHCLGLPGWASTRRNIYPPLTPLLINHPLSASSTTIHSMLPVQFTCLRVLCKTSLQVLFGQPLGLEPFTSYSIHLFIPSLSSFRNTCQTIITCYAVILRLCHLFLVSLSTLYLELYLLP